MAGYIGSKASVVSNGAERKKVFDITTTTTSLTGCSYTPNQVHVFHNGVRLVDGTDYTATDGSTVTLTTAAQSGDEVVVVSYATFQPADAYTKTESDDRFVNDPNAVITVSGSNVGIGTASPVVRLHAYDPSTDAALYVDSGSANGSHMRFLASGSVKHYVGSGGGFALGDADDYAIRSFDNILFSTGNSSTERMRVDASGRVTMPYQPAFQVRLSSIQSISANTRTKVAFDTIDYENGNNYNTTNRRFTAPVTGFYQFNVIVYAYTVSNHEVTLWKNGSFYIRSQFENGASVNPTNGILVAATKLTAGDYVEIFSQVNENGALYHSGERPTTWSGFLIC